MMTETLSMRACHESRRGSSTTAPPRCGFRGIRFDASASPRKHPRTTENCFSSHRISTSTRTGQLSYHPCPNFYHLQRSTRTVVKVLAWPAFRLQPPNAPNPKVGVEHVGPLKRALEKTPPHAFPSVQLALLAHTVKARCTFRVAVAHERDVTSKVVVRALVRMGWTPLHTAARDGDMKRLNRCVKDIQWLVGRPPSRSAPRPAVLVPERSG
jgi:hypothetical protein